MQNVVITSGVRTAIGTFGGSLKDYPAPDLAGLVIREAIQRSNVEPEAIGDVIIGQCMQRTDELPTGRLAALKAGLPIQVPGVTIQRNCASGMQAIVYAAQQIMLGDMDIAIAGGVEVMSRVPYTIDKARWGIRLQHTTLADGIWDGLTDAWSGLIMGLTAENLAEKYNISREEQDIVALKSHNFAEKAIKEGKFKDEIIPVQIKGRKGNITIFEQDEHVRMGSTLEQLAALKPTFKKDGTVTAGNSSGINDAAAAVVVMSEKEAERRGLEPMGRRRCLWSSRGRTRTLGYGPVPATKIALERAKMKLDDIELIELNEAFAAQYLTCEKLLNLNREITSVNGSGIALGHPVGCTGTRIVITLLNEMKRRNLKYGLATLCVGGGMGMATIWSRD
jgi:acetyl-CoA C-acetyltransferase